MREANLYVTLDGHRLHFSLSLSAEDFSLIQRGVAQEGVVRAEELAVSLLQAGKYVDSTFTDMSSIDWSMTLGSVRSELFDEIEWDSEALPTAAIGRCRSLLARASSLLPPDQRQEALDEWADEIETAAKEERPIVRRTLSIVLRALPVMALRMRLPSRAPRGGG